MFPCKVEKILDPDPVIWKPSTDENAVPGCTWIISLPVEVKLCANTTIGANIKSVINFFIFLIYWPR